MAAYSKDAIAVFLKQQCQLFEEVIAESAEEAEEVLEENMAVEVNSLKEVKNFLDDNGMDIAGMTDEEILEQSEVFALPGGRFLIVAF